MAIDMKSVLGDFGDADPTKAGQAGNKITVPGEFTVQIEAVRIKESAQYQAVYLIVEFKVLESTSDKIDKDVVYGWSHNIIEKFFGAANAKQFLAAALGIDPASDEAKALGQTEMEEAWSEAQPLAGEIVQLTTAPKTTKGGFDFMVHKWEPVMEDASA